MSCSEPTSRLSPPPMQRILYVQHYSGLGGSPLSLLYLVEQLDRQRYTPMVLFNSQRGPAIELFSAQGVEVCCDPRISTYQHGQGAWLSLRSLRPWEIMTKMLQIWPSTYRFRQFLESQPCDLVHLNSMVQIPAALGAKSAGVPVVWHIREEIHPGYLGLRRALVRRCVDHCATAVIAISKQNADQLIPSPKVRVIYNFVNFNHFDRRRTGTRFREALGIAPNRPLVVTLGGATHSKGTDVFVEAAARVRQAYPNVLFLIAGTPPQGESPSRMNRTLRRAVECLGRLPNLGRRTLALIAQHCLHDTVRFVGMRSDVPEMLAASAMVVWPATVSHFGRPIIEAGAMARPVIASDFPSSRELVQPGETGLLVPPSDPHQLAEAIQFLLDHPAEARRMGETGYQLARERYDARMNAAATFAVYDEVLAQRASSGRDP